MSFVKIAEGTVPNAGDALDARFVEKDWVSKTNNNSSNSNHINSNSFKTSKYH